MREGGMTVRAKAPLLGEQDLFLFHEGTHRRAWEKLGAHVTQRDGVTGTHFGVWAPNAISLSVIGDFNGWDKGKDPLEKRTESGVWEGFVAGVGPGSVYKYHVASKLGGYRV